MSRRVGIPSIGAARFPAGGSFQEPRDADGVVLQHLIPDELQSPRMGSLNPDITASQEVWLRFAERLAEVKLGVDLDRVGLDALALSALPARIALEYPVIPVRVVSEVLILAVAESGYDRAKRELPSMLSRFTCRFALADADDIRRAVRFCYDMAS